MNDTKDLLIYRRKSTLVLLLSIVSFAWILKFIVFTIRVEPNLYYRDYDSIAFIYDLCFGFGVLMILKRLSSRTPAIIISKEGLKFDLSFHNKGFVFWQDILNIKELDDKKHISICLIVKNSNKENNNLNSDLSRKLRNDMLGIDVIEIPVKILNCNHKSLRIFIETKLEELRREEF